MERIINIVCGLITLLGVAALIGFVYVEVTEEDVIYDTIITETIEVTYFDSSIDTLEVDRNEVLDYNLENGDLTASIDYVGEYKHWYTTYLIKSGVRDYTIIDTLR